MYALDANAITGHKAVVGFFFFFFFLAEHLAALIKPDLINSDKGRKIEREKQGENWRKFTTRTQILQKNKKINKKGGGSGGKLHSTLKGYFTPSTSATSRQQTTK